LCYLEKAEYVGLLDNLVLEEMLAWSVLGASGLGTNTTTDTSVQIRWYKLCQMHEYLTTGIEIDKENDLTGGSEYSRMFIVSGRRSVNIQICGKGV
jgi:hypothetical protein